MRFHKNVLKIDTKKETDKICNFIKKQTLFLRRKGAVVGLSGGIDSAVCAELCARALGKENVLGLILPEKESNSLSRDFALKQACETGINTEVIDITPVLEAFGSYEKRDKVVKIIFPEYKSGFKSKISLPRNLLDKDAYNIFSLTIDDGSDYRRVTRLNNDQLSSIVASTNTKQRTRMMHLYYYAEQMNYLVCGTTNRSEYTQGFFVKHGDGGVDIEPILHLYKSQVYLLAESLDIITEIKTRTPSPDTYSWEVSDEEFYFRMPFKTLDLLLYAWENKVSIDEICKEMGLKKEQVERAFRDFNSKYKATAELRQSTPSLLC